MATAGSSPLLEGRDWTRRIALVKLAQINAIMIDHIFILVSLAPEGNHIFAALAPAARQADVRALDTLDADWANVLMGI